MSNESRAREVPEREVTLGTTTVRVARANPNRVALIIMNRSDTAVFISTKATVTTTTGFRLEANSGSVTYTKRDFGFLPAQEFFGVTSEITKVVTVAEVILE